MYYKIASLYFGSGDFEKSIDYLQKIIRLKIDLRTDIQCYARLLHLIAHYELGNHEILEYLLKSVYRFMSKMQNLSTAEEAVFSFLKKSFSISPEKVKPLFIELLQILQSLADLPLENRAFMYLDIVSWLQSKIEGKLVQHIIHEKYLSGKKRE
jgi:tetratricopeptide (TPR) repeat protein